jgi:hypothetical protein
MSAQYEKSQLTKILISSLPTTKEAMDSAVYLDLSCTLKEAQFTGGQKQDIDVTTLCSTEQENTNGLPLLQRFRYLVISTEMLHRMPYVMRMIMTPHTVSRLSSRQVMGLSSLRRFVSTPGHLVLMEL